MPLQASYGLRKVEAKVLGIYVMDPFGIGLSSSTFSRILKTGEPYVAKYFQLLLEKPEVVEAKKKGFKIVVGGPGAWQLKLRKTLQHSMESTVS